MIKELYENARNKKSAGRNWKITYKINKLIAVLLVPIINSLNKKSGTDNEGKIIVSLTTFPERINIVWVTISTLMNQTIKPKRIILWLSKTQFPLGEAKLPKKLIKLKKRGLEIRFCDDLAPHKKYFYSMKEYPNDIIVTVDDDMLYPENHLEQLWEGYKKNSDCIICQYAHKITYDKNGNINPYSLWESCYGESTEPNLQIMAVGCGGVLYPPHLLDDRLLNKIDIINLCPKMDDLWLKSMEVLKGTKVSICNTGSLIYFDVIGTRKSGLQHVNALQNKNDEAIKAIINKYPDVYRLLYEDYKKNVVKAGE